MNKIHWDNRLIAIRGSRGVGKTTLMLQYIKLNYQSGSREALYCTLDSIYFTNHTLLDLIERFYLQGGKRLFLDEVHKYPSWSKELKEAYDLYPSLQITFSGSSLLNILNGDADLSRRCLPYDMYGLSFREFLMFYKDIRMPVCSLTEVLENAGEICREMNEKCRPIQMFDEYLHEGYYPFFTGNREDYYINIENVVNLILEQEMPLLCGVDPAYIRKLKALLGVLAVSVPYEVDISKLAGLIGLTRNSVIAYLQNLDKAELLTLLYSDSMSVRKMQKPDKVYLQNPNLLYAIASTPVQIGTVRETFVVSQLVVNHEVEYGKMKGDFVVDHTYIFEVGGADKNFKQIA
ncbi:ATP-binding protein, partial [Bacteroides heparinolyticus]